MGRGGKFPAGTCALAVGAGGGCLDIFILISFSLSLGDGPI